MDQFSWRRCQGCQHLTLVLNNTNTCWHCAGPIAVTAIPPCVAPFPVEDKSVVRTGGSINPAAELESLVQQDGSVTFPLVNFTPNDDAIARRLLASVFSGDFPL